MVFLFAVIAYICGMEIAKENDIIEWSFDNTYGKSLANKTFRAKVVCINKDCYGVYAEYGQDYVPFDKATIIKE